MRQEKSKTDAELIEMTRLAMQRRIEQALDDPDKCLQPQEITVIFKVLGPKAVSPAGSVRDQIMANIAAAGSEIPPLDLDGDDATEP